MQKMKTMNIAKKLLLWICSIFMCFSSTLTLGDYNDFLWNLRQLWIDVDSILKSKEIDRYELTRLLNWVNCKDCINPDSSMTSKYTYQRRSDFANRDGNAFNDITYLWGSYKWQSYYYCVAYVWDNLRMRWYPNDISPICNGKFCGTRTTTLWEFLQVVVNIADQYVYHRYLVDWKKVKTWMDGLPSGSYADTYLTNEEKFLINKNATNKISWPVPDEESFQAYIKYCMFNLKDCWMQNFGAIGQWYWPVAELNILYDNNIVEYERFVDWQTNQLVDGNYVLETLYNLFEIIDCSFNYDYDCDWLINKNDNCPNHYNPTQTDTDGDGKGDVCDDDIDGDGIKNPIWIVDDLWNVIISKYKQDMDNCLFVPNHTQSDSDWNWFGNECDKASNSLWMYIKVSPIKSTAPATAIFEAETQWNVKWDFHWTFWDGSTAQWKRVNHTFEKFGIYTVQVTANWYNNNAKASMTVLIGNDPQSSYALQISPNKQQINAWEDITFSLNKQWNFDRFQWNFWDGNSIEQTNNTVTKRFRDEWIYMVTVKWFKDGKIVAVANTIVWVWNNTYWSKFTSNKIFVNKWEKIVFQSSINWFSANDIVDVSRDFWDTKTINKNLTQEHTYDREWTYVTTQTINLKNGVALNNFTTISVWNKNIENSYAIETSINKLVSNSYEDIWFTISDRWSIPNATLVLNSYDDWYSTKSYDQLNTWPKAFSHQYTNWIYSPKNTVYIDDCIALSTEATIVIDNWDICLKALLDWTLKNIPWDMDGDWIPDICDDDIDGDGFPNLIWMINPNKTWTEINDSDISTSILKLHKWICKLDNCPTVQNQNQLDLNNNGWWDSCDNINIYKNIWSASNSIFMSTFNNVFNHANNNSIDSDGDGIADSLDACPWLPENYNWVQDFDWCPEILSENNCALTNYNYINQNFSVYPSLKTWRIHIIDPDNPEPWCEGDACKNFCLWSVNNCTSCNGKANCDQCEQSSELCGDIEWWTGPYTITAWCAPENIFHVRHDVTNLSFSFSDIFNWSCPCKKCHRFVKDVNWLVSNIWNFSVCNPECITPTPDTPTPPSPDNPTPWIEPEPNPTPIPPNPNIPDEICTGDVNKCPCKDNPNCPDIQCQLDPLCVSCKQHPKTSATWTGNSTWPFELHARCDDETQEYVRSNISGHCLNLSGKFQWGCKPRSCHRKIYSADWLETDTVDFTVDAIESDMCITPFGPNVPINGCTGTTCNTICSGDINNCPCENNPSCTSLGCEWWWDICKDCSKSPSAIRWETELVWPFTVTISCQNKTNTRYNIENHCLWLEGVLEWSCPCNTCKRFVSASWNNGTIRSLGKTFKVCGKWCKPDPECGDSVVDSGENCHNCTQDLNICIPTCWDGKYSPWETCNNCPQDLWVCPSSCGNSEIEEPEQCDHGVLNWLDWLCSPTCDNLDPNSFCGNGIIDQGEQCDLGTNNWIFTWLWSCTIACTLFNPNFPSCGNWIVNSGEDCSNCEIDLGPACIWICWDSVLNNGEQCDHGDQNGTDGLCSFECKIVTDKKYCGNAKIDFDLGEQCDLGFTNGISPFCNSQCRFPSINPVCGDAIVDNNEDCDFWSHLNWTDWINCTSSCSFVNPCGNFQYDPGEDCDTCPQDLWDKCKPEPKCDDGVIDPGENCNNCPQDLNICIPTCWDGKYSPWETCNNCPQDLWVCPSSCGNSEIEEPEQCDHGVLNWLDWLCSPTCDNLDPNSFCGNGIIDQGEQCDLGTNNGVFTWLWSCTIACTLFNPNFPSCGNWIVNSGEDCSNCEIDLGPACIWICWDSVLNNGEQCDHGDQNGIDGLCSFECKTVTGNKYCGNGIIDSDIGEQCDFANLNGISPQCNNQCRFPSANPVCGDAIVDNNEDCDFWSHLNWTTWVNCTSSCSFLDPCGNFQYDPGEDCDTCPQDLWDLCKPEPEPKPICGDSVIDPGENCNNCPQDLNTCIPTCWDGEYSPWETCNNCPQDLWVCPSSCGNSEIEEPEQCDHGVLNWLDWLCSPTCDNLDPNSFCGNGIIDQGEQCDLGTNNGVFTWLWSCTIACTLFNPNFPSCGNWIVNSGEDCSNCEIDLGPACIWICWDSVLNNGEQCDHGDQNGIDGLCSFECKTVTGNKYCGNGIIDSDIGEQCDFANLNGISPQCNNQCRFPSANPVCGDAIVDNNEDCDFWSHLNWTTWVNCTSSCSFLDPCGNFQYDPGEDCDTCPQDLWNLCKPEPRCGDGVIDSGENCDNCPQDLWDLCNGSGWLIGSGPIWPVPCEWSNCDNCVWNVNNCNILCPDNQTSNESNITWTWGVWPYMVMVQCEWNIEKQRTNISWQCLTLEKQFEWNCPCNQCRWFVQDSNWDTIDWLDFQVCKEECAWWDEPTPPTPLPDGPITTQECLACPCNYTDFWNTLSLNDDVKAILLDLWMTTLYSETIPVWIMQYLNQ